MPKLGLPIPDDGTVTRLEKEGRVPAVDTGEFVRSVRARRLTVVAAVAGLERDAVALTDGTRLEADAVMAATGYRPDLGPLVGHLGVLDGDGRPRAGRARGPIGAALHLVGFVDPRSGRLRELRLEARRVARALGRELAHAA